MRVSPWPLVVVVGVIMAQEADVIERVRARYANQQKMIKDIIVVQESDEIGEITVMRKGVKSRTELNMPVGDGKSVNTIIVYDSLEYWMISPIIGKRKISSAEARTYKYEEWQEKLSSSKVVGEDEFNGKKCFLIEIRSPEKDEVLGKIWLSKEDLIALKMELVQDKKKITTIYSDYRKVYKDIMMPFKIEIFENGVSIQKIIFKDIKVNQGLSDDLFNVDKIEVKFASPEDIMEMFE